MFLPIGDYITGKDVLQQGDFTAALNKKLNKLMQIFCFNLEQCHTDLRELDGKISIKFSSDIPGHLVLEASYDDGKDWLDGHQRESFMNVFHGPNKDKVAADLIRKAQAEFKEDV